MNIEVHILCWNEMEILPFVIKHYQKFCGHIIIYDNYSTDTSQLIAESMGCDVKRFGRKGELDDMSYLAVKNNCWKGSKADYVIVCDADEILIINASDSLELLTSSATIFKTQGWQIQSDEMPVNEITEITKGWPFSNYSKSVIFDPKAIKEINYKPGAHECSPVGHVIYSDETLYLLHYKNIGGVERLLKRNREYAKRMSYNNRKNGYGIHYLEPEMQTRKEWEERIAKSKQLI